MRNEPIEFMTNLAAENPDRVTKCYYAAWDASNVCKPECIVGHWLVGEGVPAEMLAHVQPTSDYWQDFNESSFDASAKNILDPAMLKVMFESVKPGIGEGILTLLAPIAAELTETQLAWISSAQMFQDEGNTWKDSVIRATKEFFPDNG